MHLPRVVDAVLDRLVVPGYSRVGYAVRRASWRSVPAGCLEGRTIIVTGAGGGLGAAAVRGLVALGARVEMVVRDRSRGEETAAAVLADHPGAAVDVAVCDVSSLDDVRRYAAGLRDRELAIHGVVHNAGVMPPERTETGEGHELTLATHVLGPFLLTRELRPVLRAGASPTAPSRVVFVSSGGMYTASLHPDDPEFREGTYSGGAAYARTKRAQVVLSELLADDLAGDGVVVHSMHPGWADTPGVASSMPGFHRVTGPLLRTEEQGADTVVWLLSAAEPGHSTGVFWHDRAPRPTHYLPRGGETPQSRAALWTLCVDATAA
ncbi:oxidoreductase [Actinomycetospora sp. NBRC 106375]|uniref:SDR family NAD(P)-dependent oxidoreductase n=1 Tax=Actinomycetospora sp. NBRC 106375 TaxID=3032207 RepID=UPI0024A03D4E|nr:SDR family NAD(P)-dependent oxidoreductase [Actinomycetospora sp. NBRC 106375]GLZ49894.1 oxidoreductase [Actinomycetospora sp. NBRC 106375]